MEILNKMPFVKTNRGDIGIAEDGTFAASAWRQSDELFNSIGGSKFSWLAPDGNSYTEHRDIFSRPTEDEIKAGLSYSLRRMAVSQGLIKLSVILFATVIFASCTAVKTGCPSQSWLVGGGHYNSHKFNK